MNRFPRPSVGKSPPNRRDLLARAVVTGSPLPVEGARTGERDARVDILLGTTPEM